MNCKVNYQIPFVLNKLNTEDHVPCGYCEQVMFCMHPSIFLRSPCPEGIWSGHIIHVRLTRRASEVVIALVLR